MNTPTPALHEIVLAGLASLGLPSSTDENDPTVIGLLAYAAAIDIVSAEASDDSLDAFAISKARVIGSQYWHESNTEHMTDLASSFAEEFYPGD